MNESELAEATNQPHGANPDRKIAAVPSRPAFISLLLALSTLALFWQLKDAAFINYDDPYYFAGNHHVRQGLTLQGVVWAFVTGDCANWHPLTWLSHMLDAQLFGVGPAGPHLVNVLFHAFNTVLLFLWLRQFTRAHWRSALVAALFALHPLHVESVAWISERKDVLSTFFFLLTIMAYGRFARTQTLTPTLSHPMGEGGSETLAPMRSAPTAKRGRLWNLDYFLALLFFVLGLMAKPMLVTLPFVLLLLDYWPLKRVSGVRCQVSGGEKSDEPLSTLHPSARRSEAETAPPSTLHLSPSTFWLLVREKLPFFGISAISCLITFLVQKQSGAVLTLTNIPIAMRIENAFISYARYLAKLFWPTGLALPYPYPADWAWTWVALGVCVTLGLAAAGWRLGRRWPFVRTSVFWFLGTLVPVIGLVQVGNQSLADRYTYVPLIGIFIALSWGAGAIWLRWNFAPWTAGLVAAAVLGACAARTHDQLTYWRNSETLFRHTIACTQNNGLAFDNLGQSLFAQGRLDEAMKCYGTALQISAKDPIALDGLGCGFFYQGQLDQAIALFHRALEFDPRQLSTLFNLGSAHALQQQYPEAIRCYEAALRLQPGEPDTLTSLGNVYLKQKRFLEAIECYKSALRTAPDAANAHSGLGAALHELGKVRESIPHYREAVRLAPGDAQTRIVLAHILLNQNQLEEAANLYRQALEIDPNLNDGSLSNLQQELKVRGTMRPR